MRLRHALRPGRVQLRCNFELAGRTATGRIIGGNRPWGVCPRYVEASGPDARCYYHRKVDERLIA